jgi:D-aminopeptidase
MCPFIHHIFKKVILMTQLKKPFLSYFIIAITLSSIGLPLYANEKPRARDLGIPFDGTPGPLNAITDVKGVEVGHATLISGEGQLEVGKGPIRTGVTAVLPRGKRDSRGTTAGWFIFNGAGEITGAALIEEYGKFVGPIMLTNTASVGIVRDTVIKWWMKHFEQKQWWHSLLPVVAETLDLTLNDVFGFHVKEEHVFQALDTATGGVVKEGNVGGGTGMTAYGFKSGIGTSSRIVEIGPQRFTIGVLVQSNFGQRKKLHIAGVPVGKEIPDLMPSIKNNGVFSSIIVVIGTDLPLFSYQLKRLAKRAALSLGRTGTIGKNFSGDIFIAFSTAYPDSLDLQTLELQTLKVIPNFSTTMDNLFEATVQATEEAIINALIAAETMTGINGNTVYALPHDRLRSILKKYNRLVVDKPTIGSDK